MCLFVRPCSRFAVSKLLVSQRRWGYALRACPHGLLVVSGPSEQTTCTELMALVNKKSFKGCQHWTAFNALEHDHAAVVHVSRWCAWLVPPANHCATIEIDISLSRLPRFQLQQKNNVVFRKVVIAGALGDRRSLQTVVRRAFGRFSTCFVLSTTVAGNLYTACLFPRWEAITKDIKQLNTYITTHRN